MCTTCGCGTDEVKIEGGNTGHGHGHQHVHANGTRHSHAHDGAHQHHPHDHNHPPHSHGPAVAGDPSGSQSPDAGAARRVQIEQDILAGNNAYARQNRQWLAGRGIFALNLVSGPGSGKTTLLCKTIPMLAGLPVAVIEGDQQTSRDAERIRATGAPAVQINTGKGCHLDAHMVAHAMDRLDLREDSLLLIENVGNLVCPAAFDLGEAHKVVILSVTEGEDKPLKYPDMFRAASVMVLNKIDLLPHVDFDLDAALEYARRVNPQIRVIRLSATRGDGMDEWLQFLREGAVRAAASRRATVDHLNRRIEQLEAQLAAMPSAASPAEPP